MKAKTSFELLWLAEQFQKIRPLYTEEQFQNEQLKKLLLKKYQERYQPVGRFYNNKTMQNNKMSLEQFINILLNTGVILSGYAGLYKNQDEQVNIGASALEFLLNSRKKFKKKMEESEWGSDEYYYYKIVQLTYKILANSYYGILGEKNSIFYDPFIQNSTTMTGQDIITTSIISMEQFLANNAKFEDTDDAITFIRNVCNEKHDIDISEYIDKIPGKDELYDYLKSHCKIPDVLNEKIIRRIIDTLSDNNRAYVFYKNRVLDLIDNSWFVNKLRHMSNYEYTTHIPDEIKDELEEFKNVVIDICFYDNLLEDRYKRAIKDTRKAIITIDTDLTERSGSSAQKYAVANFVNCGKSFRA